MLKQHSSSHFSGVFTATTIAAMATSLTQKIWIPTKDSSWELGELVSFDENSGKVVAEGSAGVQTFDKSEVHRTDPSHFLDSDDLCSMNQLHEAPLMDCLRRRFLENKIYTNTGDVLISVNPYKAIRGLYDNMLSYLDIPDDAEVSSAAKPPHLFKVANLALMELVFGKKATSRSSVSRNQSIVVSGESGAGKTEASKRVMSFLIEADHDLTVSANSSQRASLKLGDRIRKVLMESNIILEAFGNAKTVRNDNSSRFGKYIKLQYDLESRIVSAYTETFLLEKSRLVAIGTGERNYHVFYQLLRGCKDKELLSKLKLQSPEQYKLLTDEQGEAVESPDDKNFVELHSAMLTLGTTPEEMQHIWSIIAALLHLSNFQYKTTGEGPVGIESPTMAIPEICEILGISPEMFVMRLTTQIIKVSNRSSVTTKVLNAHDVNNNVMALIKWVYSSLFAWLVRKINYSHCTMTTANVVAEKFIGILDIFGFEILQTNSFEQLCINYTNERLQQQFNEFVFEREQEEYAAEGLDWTSISYKDNQHVIDLISKKPMGLLVILEGQGMLNRTDDDSALISSFNSAHDKKSLAYERSRFADSTFSVRHFAGIVTYTVKGFLEKNNDSLQEDLMELLVFSDSRFVQNAIIASDTSSQVSEEPGYVGEIPANMLVVTAGKLTASTRDTSAAKNHAKAVGRRASLMVMDTTSKKLASTVTVSFQFRGQLDLLIATLRATSPHYVKCIKPNSDKQPLQFDSAMVLEQLKYSGALEVVRIRQEG